MGAVGGEISAIEFNPAGLSNINRTDFLATYIDYIEDTSLQSISVGFPLSMKQNALNQEIKGNVFREDILSIGIQYRVLRAEDTERNNLGVKGSEFDIRDQAFGMGAAYPLNNRLSVGVTGKFIGQSIQNESLNNYGVDVGAQFKLNETISIGAAAQNLGPSKAFIQEKDPLPGLVRLSAGAQFRQGLFLADVSNGRDKITRGSTGAEWCLGPYLKLRGGVVHDTTLEFTGGLGIRFSGPEKAPVISTPRKPLPRENGERKGLEDLEKGRLSSPPAKTSSAFTNVDIGLDYGLSTHKDLGVTHTVSLRILY